MSSLLRSAPLLTRLALGGLVLATAALAPDAAWAQAGPVFEGAGLVELVAPTGLVGDGATSADLYVLALNADGTPLTGLKGKPTASGGTVTDLVEAGGGLYRFGFTPSKTEGVTTATVTFKGKYANKEAFSKTWSFPVAPPRSQRLSIATNPAQLVLGQDATASIAINLAGGDRQNLTGVDLAVRPSTGTVDNLIPLGGGQFSALFTAPTVKYPHVALLTVVDRRDPSRAYAGIAVPLVGKADYPVTVAPNARVILKVGGREFGPIAADSMGRATVPIIVPPGATTATRVQITPDGKVSEDTLDLKIPEARRIALFPSSAAIPSDGRLQVPVRAFVSTPDGKPDEGAQVVFTTTAGVVGPAKHEGGGVYVATFTPPFGNVATQATIAVTLADKPAVQADSLNISLVPSRPSKVTLASEPASLPTGADGFKVFAKVAGPDGAGLGARTLSFSANGAKLREPVKDLRNGDYQASFSTTGNGPVELTATVSSPPTGNPLARVLLLPGKERLAADGVSSALLTVVTVDEFGYPVPNQVVTLKLTQGDGQIPAQATTNGDGLAQVYYTAGRRNGVVNVSANVGDFAAGATLVQAPATVIVPDLPVGGAKDVATIAGEWQGSVVGLRLEREGVAGVAAPPVIGATTPIPAGGAGAPAKLAMTSEPATVSAGGTVILRVTVLDANGRGVGGQQLDFLTSAGTVGGVTDLGGGAYQAMLTVPAGASGEIKISAATRDGSLSSFMRVPVGGAEAAWGSNPFASSQPDPFAGTATQPTATQPTNPQPTNTAPTMGQPTGASATPATTTSVTTVQRSPTASDTKWNLRLRAGYAYTGFGYDQSLLTQNTVLYPYHLELSAGAQGLQAGVRGWIPGVPYLGADLEVRSGSYSLDPSPLCAKIERPCPSTTSVSDWNTDVQALVAGRYPFDVGSAEFWIGARVGLSASDLVVYKVVDQFLQMDPLWILSLAVGPEVGVDIGENLFFHTYFLESLAGGTEPFNTQFGVNGGYAFGTGALKPYAQLGYDFGVRSAQVTNTGGDAVGEIQDSQHSVSLSVGVQL